MGAGGEEGRSTWQREKHPPGPEAGARTAPWAAGCRWVGSGCRVEGAEGTGSHKGEVGPSEVLMASSFCSAPHVFGLPREDARRKEFLILCPGDPERMSGRTHSHSPAGPALAQACLSPDLPSGQRAPQFLPAPLEEAAGTPCPSLDSL